MDALKEYNIAFSGFKRGKHSFSYHIADRFFELFEYDELKNADFQVDLEFIKFQNFLELHFYISGTADLTCDVSNEPFTEPIQSALDLVVKFGEDYNDDNDEILILPHEAYEMNVAQYIYEAIILAIPLKKIHPGVLDGSLKSKTLDKLKEYEIRKKQGTDPRWDQLNELLKNNNHGTS